MENLLFIVSATGQEGPRTGHSQQRFYSTFEQALYSVLTEDLRRYGSYRKTSDTDAQLDKVTISYLGQQQAELVEIPIPDSLPDGPRAGIYLEYSEGNITDLGNRLDIRLPAFRDLDRGIPLLQLARYNYDGDISILPDMSLVVFTTDLQKKLKDQQWNYVTSSIEIDQKQDNVFHQYYHYQSLKDAFLRLSTSNFTAADDNLDLQNNNGKMLLSASVQDQGLQPVITMQVHTTDSGNNQPGRVLLFFEQGTQEFETATGLSLITMKLPDSPRHLQVAAYTPDGRYIEETNDFALFKKSIQAPVLSQYALHYIHHSLSDWKNAIPPAGNSYSTFEEALMALLAIDQKKFDQMELSEVLVVDSKTHAMVASITNLPGGDLLSQRLCVSINQDAISLDVLKIIGPLMPRIDTSGHTFLFYDQPENAVHQIQQKHSARQSWPSGEQGGGQRI